MDSNITMVSPYLHLFNSKKHGYLGYNGINNSFMKLNKPLYNLLKKAVKNANELNNLDKTTYNILIQKKVLCTNNDITFLKNQKRLLHNIDTYDSSELALTIAPTTACNFKCPYCYEAGVGYKTMDEKTINQTITFVTNRAKNTNNQVSITWYGGEPLLAINIIEHIYDSIIDAKININHSSIITNGYYLNNKNIEILQKIGVKTIQITFDGATADEHNSRRFTANNKGSWHIILSNIDNFLQKNTDIKLLVRCNLDRKNKDSYNSLKQMLEKRWNNNCNVMVYPAILQDHEVCTGNECTFLTSTEADEFTINERVNNHNLPYFEYAFRGCAATQFNAYVIGPCGELYKCWNDMGRDDKVVGNVIDDYDLNNELIYKYMVSPTIFDDNECQNCKLFFVCNGGCQYFRLKQYKNGTKYSNCHIAKNNLTKYLDNYYSLKLAHDEKQ